jgi:nucleolar protein 16
MEDDGQEWGGIDDDDDEEAGAGRGAKKARKGAKVVRQLEAEARRPVEKKVRHQSEREKEWLARLVERHGDDTAAMARDMKLNPMQQTEADIARRIKKWKESQKAQ